MTYDQLRQIVEEELKKDGRAAAAYGRTIIFALRFELSGYTICQLCA